MPDEEVEHARLLRQTDDLQNALLNSISHNVRTPLAAILGSLSTLQDEYGSLEDSIKRELIDNARAGAERLNRLLGNLLDMSRLEAGALQIRRDLCDVQDVIGAALEQLGSVAARRTIEVIIPPNLPFVRMDFVLIVQVIVNLLNNALKYSAECSPVTLETIVLDGTLEVRVLDDGYGIPAQDLTKVFEKFNRAARSGETGGIGLGLSICKGLIEAHKGNIWAQRREPRGTTVAFCLPLGCGAGGAGGD
ncbi:MAG: sensor histidine kinase [Bryobacteraceae bacterium]